MELLTWQNYQIKDIHYQFKIFFSITEYILLKKGNTTWNLSSAMHYPSKNSNGRKDSQREREFVWWNNTFRNSWRVCNTESLTGNGRGTQRVWQEMAEEHRESDRKWQRNTESLTRNGRETQRVWQEMTEEHRESGLTGNGRGTQRVWQEMAEDTKSLTGSGRGTQRVWQKMGE